VAFCALGILFWGEGGVEEVFGDEDGSDSVGGW
jgi:hypothetical protein